MLFRNIVSKIIPGHSISRVASLASIGIAFTLSLALILNGFVGLRTVLNEYALSQDDSMAAAASAAAAKSKNGGGTAANQAPVASDRIIVKFKDSDLPPGLDVAAERANIEQAEGLNKLFTIDSIDVSVYEIPGDSTADEVIQRVKAKAKDTLEFIEIDMLVPATFIPNDPSFATQWYHTNIKSQKGWDTTLGDGVTVAILDTGVDPNHSDLEFSDEPGWNFYDNNSNWADIHGHGTWVAGAAAAVGNNAIGIAGVAPNAKILPLRIADPSAYAYMSTIAKAITYAADHGARVANASYSTVCGSATIWTAAKYLRSKGGVFVSSAGNSNSDNAYAATPELTCVSATGANDLKASFSSWGVSTDMAAPGTSIYTTARGGGYQTVQGTSFSAPITAGLYALLFSVNPQLTPAQADNIVFSTAKDIGDAGWDKNYGFGLVDVEKAVALASSTKGTWEAPDASAPTVPTNLVAGTVTYNSVALSWGPSTDDRAVAQYSVYRNGTKIATVGGTSYASTGLLADTAYTYTVRAEDSALNQSGDSNTVSVKTEAAPFGISTFSVPSKTATSAVASVTLTKPGMVTVKYGTSAGSLSASAQSTVANTAHTLSLTGLAAGTTYYYQVVATDANGTSITSAVSSFKTPRAAGATGKKR